MGSGERAEFRNTSVTFGALSWEGTGSAAVHDAKRSGFLRCTPGSGMKHAAGVVMQLHRCPGL